MMIPQNHLLIISSPNNGGFLTVDNSLIPKYIDEVSTTGFCFNENLFIRSIQRQDFSELQFYHRDGSFSTNINTNISDIHDILIKGDNLYIVSTGTNEVLCQNLNDNEVHKYNFPGHGDAWHLNCLDIWNDKVVVSAFGEFLENRGYKGRTGANGFVFDLLSGEKLYENLSQPHSPKKFADCEYVCDSESKRLIILKNGQVFSELKFDSYTRGLYVTSDYIYLGLNNSRNAQNCDSTASVVILNRVTLEEVNRIYFPVNEIYDIKLIERSKFEEFNIRPNSSLFESLQKDLNDKELIIQQDIIKIGETNQKLEEALKSISYLEEDLRLKDKNLERLSIANIEIKEKIYEENGNLKVQLELLSLESFKDKELVNSYQENIENKQKQLEFLTQEIQYQEKYSIFFRKHQRNKLAREKYLMHEVESLKAMNISLQNIAQNFKEKCQQYLYEKNHFEQWLKRESDNFNDRYSLVNNELEMLRERNNRLVEYYEKSIHDLNGEIKRISELHHSKNFELEQIKKQLDKG